MEENKQPTLKQTWDTLPGVWTIVVLTGIFFVVSKGAVAPNDFWWHMRAGQVIVQQQAIPTTDLFSYTRYGQSWVYQAWLTEIGFYLTYQVGGLELLLLLKALLITGSYILLFSSLLRCGRGDWRLAALVTLFAAALGITNTDLRPQVVSFPLFAWTLRCVIRDERAPGRSHALWSLPPLFILWANSHGGFVFGLALLGATAVGRLLEWLLKRAAFPRQFVIITALCAAAVFVSPMGFGVVDYVLGFVRHPITSQLNQEFMPPTIRELTGQLFFALTTLFVVLLIASRYRPRPAEVMRLLVFAALALSATRCVVWFGFIAAPTLATAVAHWAGAREQVPKIGFRLVNRLFFVLMLGLCILSLPWLRPYIHISGTQSGLTLPETPIKAAEYLNSTAQERQLKVYHTEGAGSYLIWASPQVPVFIDTRIELYPAEQWQDYIDIGHALYNWEALLAKYQVNTLLLEPALHSELIAAASASPNWQRTYEDKQYVVFEQVQSNSRAK